MTQQHNVDNTQEVGKKLKKKQHKQQKEVKARGGMAWQGGNVHNQGEAEQDEENI